MHLRWPTDLSINPLDNSLHIVDDHMILRMTADGRVKVVAGRPLQCPPTAHLDTDLEFATQATLVMPQSITFATNGDLYIGESDSQRINRVRIIGKSTRKLEPIPSAHSLPQVGELCRLVTAALVTGAQRS